MAGSRTSLCRPLLTALDGFFGRDQPYASLDSQDADWRLACMEWTDACRPLKDASTLQRCLDFLSEHEKQSLLLLRSWSSAAYCEASIALWPCVQKALSGEIDVKNDRQYTYSAVMLRLFYGEVVHALYRGSQGNTDKLYSELLVKYRREAIISARIQEEGYRLLGIAVDSAVCPQISSEKQVGLLTAEGGHSVGQRQGLPYYLWDREAGATIQTDQISGPIVFTAISHTWGRWEKRGEHPFALPGVAWPVPQNTRFDVSSLPTLLMACPCETPYVWLDLVCIPQGHRLESTIAQREIARQGEIFRAAEHVLTWLTDVTEGLETMDVVLEYMLLDLLDLPADSDTYHRAVDQQSELSLPKSAQVHGLLISGDDGTPELNSWFTSLWTLQEAWLRPDLCICNFSWQHVVLRSGWTPQVLWIIAVIQRWSDKCLRISSEGAFHVESSLGTYELANTNGGHPTVLGDSVMWLLRTGMSVLLEPWSLQLLPLGNRRHCYSRRAEAIMSAVNAIEWYREIPYEDHEVDLLLGKYPLAFVQEIVAKEPGIFFLAASPSWETISMSRDAVRVEDSTHVGSLLPFGGQLPETFVQTTEWFETHDSVFTWTIHKSGHVRLPQACIVCSNSYAVSPLLPDAAYYQTVGGFDQYRDESEGSLTRWVMSMRFETNIVVVKMGFSAEEVGLRILACVAIARDEAEQLVNLGTCYVLVPADCGWEMPTTLPVDWVVA